MGSSSTYPERAEEGRAVPRPRLGRRKKKRKRKRERGDGFAAAPAVSR